MAINLFKYATGGGQNLFQLVDIFSGGAFAKMTVFALGVMPYIQASIVLQLLIALVPSLQREIRESPDQGRRKLSKWTRLSTLLFALLQAGLFAKYALTMNRSSPGIVVSELIDVQIFGFSWLFYLTVMVTMTAGTLFLMWIGEQITEKGVGLAMQFPTDPVAFEHLHLSDNDVGDYKEATSGTLRPGTCGCAACMSLT